VLSFVRGGLRDLSISRSTFSWGIPVPDDPKHVVYVWLDALANYITALGYGSSDTSKFDKYWPADVHMIGKEIVRFHCVYWPAFLLAAGLPLPKSITAHGWLLFEESKMSKSRGNIVRAETIVDVLGTDALRYFLLREVVFGQDGSFSFDALVQRYNSDLANGLGNLASRTLTMITRYFKGEVPYPSNAAHTPADERLRRQREKRSPTTARSLISTSSRARSKPPGDWSVPWTNTSSKTNPGPWTKKGRREPRAPGHRALHQRRSFAHCHRSRASGDARRHRKDLGAMGLGDIKKFDLTAIAVGTTATRHKTGRGASRVSAGRQIGSREDAENGRTKCKCGERRASRPSSRAKPGSRPRAPATQVAPAKPAAAIPDGKISIDDFAKVELRVAQVKTAERVKGADKLLRLEVDLGTEVRQLVAGIAEAYEPEALIGRKVVIVANLAPRKLRGLESNGMIVAASPEGGKPVLASFLEDVPVGTRLK
jgi:methionyl-tRNA synthetase